MASGEASVSFTPVPTLPAIQSTSQHQQSTTFQKCYQDLVDIGPYTDVVPESAKAVPLTCHGHSRPVTHLSFSDIVEDGQYYLLSSCKGSGDLQPCRLEDNSKAL